MLYEILNGSKKHRQVVDDAMSFVINYLNLPEDVWVDVEFVSCISNGGCIELEDNAFSVEINRKQSVTEMIATLFHEMKHVEQYAAGRLGQTSWLGQEKPKLDYLDQPWEKEAFAFESRIVKLYRASSAR